MSKPGFWEFGDFRICISVASLDSHLLVIVLFTPNLHFSAVWRPCAPEGNLAFDERRSQMSNPLQKALKMEAI